MKSFVSFVVGLSFLSLAACAVSSEEDDGAQQSEASSTADTRVVTHMARQPEEPNEGKRPMAREARPDERNMPAENAAPLSPVEAKRDDYRPFSRTNEVR